MCSTLTTGHSPDGIVDRLIRMTSDTAPPFLFTEHNMMCLCLIEYFPVLMSKMHNTWVKGAGSVGMWITSETMGFLEGSLSGPTGQTF